jgi:ribonucleotide monophosphatase NagD (HAD superfamily)
VFCSPGGGEREERKAKKLADVLDIPVHPSQIVLSHTPLRSAVEQHADQKILVLGCREVDDVARSYGAKRVYTVPDLARDDPTRYPFLHWDHVPLPGSASERAEPFGAVFILHDPNNWGAEIQVGLFTMILTQCACWSKCKPHCTNAGVLGRHSGGLAPGERACWPDLSSLRVQSGCCVCR